MKKILILVACISCPSLLLAQNRGTVTLSGYVQDEATGERLIGAGIYVPNQRIGCTTNRYGYFSLQTARRPATVTVSYVGYQSAIVDLSNERDTVLTIRLIRTAQDLQEVTIRQSSGKDTYQEATMGRFIVPLDYVRKGPALLGENDIIKTLQLLPGVQAGTEGTVGLNVRGGSPDQNLVLLDGMPVYNLNHLFGFFSIVNSDAVAQAEFLKGSIPARYGGRLSSVLDISLREGNLKRWKGNFSLSPIAGRITVEGPLKKDVSSILISARRTWFDALSWTIGKLTGANQFSGYGFYDLNAKWNYKLSDRDRVFLSAYTGQDQFSTRTNINEADYRYRFAWGNQTLGFRWNHVYNQRLFSTITLNYTRFEYRLKEQYHTQKYFVNNVSSGIQDLAIKTDFDYYADPHHAIKFGLGLTRHRFRPEIKQFAAESADTTVQPTQPVITGELAAYVEDDWLLSDRWRLNTGVHYANQWVEGRLWNSLQPRISVRYLIGNGSALKASYNRMTQFLHLLTNSSVGLPTDLWVPVTRRIPPEQASWWSLGYSRSLPKSWNLSLETYYKQMQNILEYKEGTSFLNSFSTPWYERVSVGKSTSYGVEAFIEKAAGRNKGWISYTLSWTDRQFADLNAGRPFPYKYDRRHNLAVVISHDFTKNKSLSFNFMYSSGTALTLAGSRYKGILLGSDLLTEATMTDYAWANTSFYYNVPNLLERNNFRAPDYHRLDISYKTTRAKKHGLRTWIIACYNTYNHMNPFYLYFDNAKLKQFTLFPVIPSLTYQLDF